MCRCAYFSLEVFQFLSTSWNNSSGNVMMVWAKTTVHSFHRTDRGSTSHAGSLFTVISFYCAGSPNFGLIFISLLYKYSETYLGWETWQFILFCPFIKKLTIYVTSTNSVNILFDPHHFTLSRLRWSLWSSKRTIKLELVNMLTSNYLKRKFSKQSSNY